MEAEGQPDPVTRASDAEAGIAFCYGNRELMNKHLIGGNCDVTGSGQVMCQQVKCL